MQNDAHLRTGVPDIGQSFECAREKFLFRHVFSVSLPFLAVQNPQDEDETHLRTVARSVSLAVRHQAHRNDISDQMKRASWCAANCATTLPKMECTSSA